MAFPMMGNTELSSSYGGPVESEQPARKELTLESIRDILVKMEWSAIEAEEDWQPDGNSDDMTYNFRACCPVCRGRREWTRDGGPIGHESGCLMGELCKS